MEFDVECTGSFSTYDMSDEEVCELFEERFPDEIQDADFAQQYFHGDLDLSKLFKEIGKEEVQKIIDSI